MNGKAKGYTVASFDWSQSEFSGFFHVKRVTTEGMFVDVWKEFVAPSLDETSGVYNINKNGNQQSATPTTTRRSPPTSERNASTGSEPRTTSRKRKAEDETPRRTLPPSLRPIRVVSTEDNHSKDVQATDQAMDQGIEKAFVGKY